MWSGGYAKRGVELNAVLLFDLRERSLEVLVIDLEDDIAVHVDEPPVGVVDKPAVAGLGDEAWNRGGAETAVED